MNMIIIINNNKSNMWIGKIGMLTVQVHWYVGVF